MAPPTGAASGLDAELRGTLQQLSHSQSGIDFVTVFPLPEDYDLPLTGELLRHAFDDGGDEGGGEGSTFVVTGLLGQLPPAEVCSDSNGSLLWKLRALAYLVAQSLGEVQEGLDDAHGVWQWWQANAEATAGEMRNADHGDVLLLKAEPSGSEAPRLAAGLGALTAVVRTANAMVRVAVVCGASSDATLEIVMQSPSPPPAAARDAVRITPLGGQSFGAVVEGISLATGSVQPPVFEQLLEAFRRHRLLLFRGQDGLLPTHETAFVKKFGELTSSSDPGIIDPDGYFDSARDNSATPLDENPMTICQGRGVRLVDHYGVSKVMGHSRSTGSGLRDTRHWHSDGYSLATPPVITFMHCLHAPAANANVDAAVVDSAPVSPTTFADGVAAHARLPPALRAQADILIQVSSRAHHIIQRQHYSRQNNIVVVASSRRYSKTRPDPQHDHLVSHAATLARKREHR
jgi:alpha-ketoglutarate-dependent taurine dioxygenase